MGTHSRISFNVKKHVVKHPLKSNLHVIYKKLQCLLKCQKKGNLSVTCVCFKVSKSADIPSIQLKKKKKNVPYRSCVFITRFGPRHQFQ